MDEKRLFLLDAYALIYRAYYALIRSPRVTSSGFNTSAIFGFCNTLDEILRKENPTHIAVCFDPPKSSTFRHEMYPEYKAQRQAQPEDITLSIPYIKEIIAAYNIQSIEIDGFEADDVIGTLANRAQAEGYTTFMMTPDKDYGQLVTDRVLMYRPSLRGRDFEIRGVKQVCERYGISSPRQVIDLLALEGDASDNIPGCPGVGEKTAVKLIEQFGSVENLIANAGEIKGALGKKVAENVEQIKLSKELATIKTDVPIDIDIDSLSRKAEDVDALRRIYTKLEFKSFIARLGGAERQPAESPQPAATVKNEEPSLFDFDTTAESTASRSVMGPEVETLTDLAVVSQTISKAIESKTVGLAVYAPGAEAMTAHLKGFALSFDAQTYWIPSPSDTAQLEEFASVVQPLFASIDVTIISHDVKRDMITLRNAGIRFEASYFDTSVAHYLLQPEMRHRLPDLAYSYLRHTTIDAADTVRAKDQYPEYPDNEIAARLGEAASLMIPLRDALLPLIEKDGLAQLMNDIEFPLIPVLADMEWTGVRIDVAELNRLSAQLSTRLKDMEHEAYQLAGKTFNISSPKQVGEVLFVDLGIDPKAKRTKKGFFSTTEEILESYRTAHPIVELILKIRALNKLLATYINALPTLINPRTGKIHTTYNQTVTATGRISSANPNLQNIPIRTDDGKEIRRAFIADQGDLLLSADYSQIELRLMADLSHDPDMVGAFRSGADIHQATAAKIYHTPIDEVTDEQRRHAKTANFGIIYGISPFGLSQRLGIPRAEAKKLIDGYFASYPGAQAYIDKATADARANGYVMTIAGRRRYLPDINSRNAGLRSYAERNAVNAPLQGSAADIIKIAMVRIHRRIADAGMKSRMIMQVHDELIFNVHPDELPALQKMVTEEMMNAYHGDVTLEVASGVAKNWLEAH